MAPGLDWRFTPDVPEIEAKLGETQTVFYKVRNAGSTPSTGIATFNVQPGQAGAFFVKIQCFCFTEQTLQPGEAMDFRRRLLCRSGLGEGSDPAGPVLDHPVLHLFPIEERAARGDKRRDAVETESIIAEKRRAAPC